MLVLILGLLTDLFNCITQHLVFSDLMMIFFGQVAPIERLRVPLQNFVSTNVLNGQEPNDVNIEQAVNRLMANMEHDIEETAVSLITCPLLLQRFCFFIYVCLSEVSFSEDGLWLFRLWVW